MRVGIIGAGLQGWRRAPIIRRLPQHDLVVVSDIRLDAAKELAQELGCEASEGWRHVVERSDIDAVVVCTPPHVHKAISVAAMLHGKHVLCEKPLARTVDEVTEMIAVANATGLVLKCGFNHRHHPAIRQAHLWFHEGKIGEPLFLRARYGIGGRPGYETEWRCDPEIVGGGHLMEQGIHLVDLSRWFLGDFTQVAAFVDTQFWAMEPLEDNAFVMYRTAAGVVATIHSSLTQWRNMFSFELYGRDGYINVEGIGGSYGTERVSLGPRDFTAPFKEEVVEFRREDQSWLEEWLEFSEAIDQGRQPSGDGYDGLAAMRLVYAAYEASSRQRTISLE